MRWLLGYFRALLHSKVCQKSHLFFYLNSIGLNPYLQVVARASSREMEEKLLRAGADRVVTPYTIGGQRMALGLLQPAVNEFLNSVVFDAEKHTELGEMEVREHPELVGRTLRESRLRER